MTEIEDKLNRMLKPLPVPRIITEVSDAPVVKKREPYKVVTPPVSLPKIKPIKTQTLPTAVNGLVGADKGIPSTLTGEYIMIGSTLVPKDFFKKKTQVHEAPPGAFAAAKKNKEIVALETYIKKEVPEEQRISNEKRKATLYENKLENERRTVLETDFHQFSRSIGITEKNANVEEKMSALKKLLNMTSGNINIVENNYIDSVITLYYSDYDRKKARHIRYVQPNIDVLNYVKNNNLFGKLHVEYATSKINPNYEFTFLDLTGANYSDLYKVLCACFIDISNAAYRSPKRVLVACDFNIGLTENEFYQTMGFNLFKTYLGPKINPGKNERYLEDFYNSMFSTNAEHLGEYKVSIEPPILFKRENIPVSPTLHIKEEINRLNDLIIDNDTKINEHISLINGYESRGETINARMMTEELHRLYDFDKELRDKLKSFKESIHREIKPEMKDFNEQVYDIAALASDIRRSSIQWANRELNNLGGPHNRSAAKEFSKNVDNVYKEARNEFFPRALDIILSEYSKIGSGQMKTFLFNARNRFVDDYAEYNLILEKQEKIDRNSDEYKAERDRLREQYIFIDGKGFITGGALNARDLAKLHSVIFFKKIEKIDKVTGNIFLFTF